jgi:hypothetical protein
MSMRAFARINGCLGSRPRSTRSSTRCTGEPLIEIVERGGLWARSYGTAGLFRGDILKLW